MKSLILASFLLMSLSGEIAFAKKKVVHRRDARKACVEEGHYDRKAIKKCVQEKIASDRENKKKSSS
jgi:hypothetical protein